MMMMMNKNLLNLSRVEEWNTIMVMMKMVMMRMIV